MPRCDSCAVYRSSQTVKDIGKERGRDEKTKKGKEKKMEKVLLILNHKMLPHYCIITKIAIIASFLKPKYLVQDLMGRAKHFLLTIVIIKVQSNRIIIARGNFLLFIIIIIYFINQIHLSNYLIAVN